MHVLRPAERSIGLVIAQTAFYGVSLGAVFGMYEIYNRPQILYQPIKVLSDEEFKKMNVERSLKAD